jgi:FtsH-binding integral membrane protein
MVEEGRVFCPHCKAPQIRVMVVEPMTVAASSPMQQGPLTASETVPVIAVPMRWDQAAQPCAVAALIAALGMVLQLIVPVIAAIGAGFLAVALYRRRNPEIAVHARTGARLGAIAGFFCAGMTAILGTLRVAILREGGKIRAALLAAVDQQAVRYNDPQSQTVLDFLRSPTGILLFLVFLIIVGIIVLIVLGMLGGALGGASLSRRDRG